MKKALFLALKGRGRVHPNPLVGAVVVKSGRILGQGAHEYFGGPHAELNAIRAAGNAGGATLYVTLEPCAHSGKTPPCTNFIIKNKIKRMVVATKDVNPLVSGKGLAQLKKAGISVKQGVLEAQARELNRDFNFWIRHRRPYVIVKSAQSVDGKIATFTGDSKWISSEASRDRAHALRAASDAVLVGVNTVIKDDPELTVRRPKTLPADRQPIKIVLDSTLRTPVSARLFKNTKPESVWIVTANSAPISKEKRYRDLATVIRVKKVHARLDLKGFLQRIGKQGVVNVLIEGGGEVIAHALKEKLVHEMHCVIAPKIIGGKNAVNAVSGEGIALVKKAIQLKNLSVELVGGDIWVKGSPRYV